MFKHTHRFVVASLLLVLASCRNDSSNGDGISEINECSIGTHNCDINATCTDTADSFTCTCNTGYSGNGVTCTDIDECTAGVEGHDACTTNASCTNSAGGYSCACNYGYHGADPYYGGSCQVLSLIWSIATVDSDDDVGMYTSIVLDSIGYPHISYGDATNRSLKYTKWTGTVWSIETVESDVWFRGYTSIELDSNGYPHISYNDTNPALKHAKWTGNKWSIETIDSDDDVGGGSSIALDSNDYPHISY